MKLIKSFLITFVTLGIMTALCYLMFFYPDVGKYLIGLIVFIFAWVMAYVYFCQN